MAFRLTSRRIWLDQDGEVLLADCQTSSGGWQLSYLNLNEHLSIIDKNFSFLAGQSGFRKSITTVKLEGVTLHASYVRRIVNTLTVYEQKWECSLNLDYCVQNDDGRLKFVPYSPSVHDSACFFYLQTPRLSAICLGSDGKLHDSTIVMADARQLMSNLPDGPIQRSQIPPSIKELLEIRNGDLIQPMPGLSLSYPINGQIYPEWFANFLLSIPGFGSVVSLFGDNYDRARTTYATMILAATYFGGLFSSTIGPAIGAACMVPFALIAKEYHLRGLEFLNELINDLAKEFVERILVTFISVRAGTYFAAHITQQARYTILDPKSHTNFLIETIVKKFVTIPSSQFSSILTDSLVRLMKVTYKGDDSIGELKEEVKKAPLHDEL